MAKIPYSAGDGATFSPLPQGTYDFRIDDTIVGTSRNGNPQLQLKMEVLDGPSAGKKVSTWYSLLPQSGWVLDKLLEALDIEREDTGDVDDNGDPIKEFDSDWLIGRCVQFDVTQREWNGKKNNQFDNARASEFDPPEDGADAPPPAAEPPAAQAAPSTMKRRPRPQR